MVNIIIAFFPVRKLIGTRVNFFYTGLAQGRMGIVAPVSAVVTALLPVVAALFTEGFPGRLKLAGFATALIAVWWLVQARPCPTRQRP